jgi:hypothetical protein
MPWTFSANSALSSNEHPDIVSNQHPNTPTPDITPKLVLLGDLARRLASLFGGLLSILPSTLFEKRIETKGVLATSYLHNIAPTQHHNTTEWQLMVCHNQVSTYYIIT